MVNLLRKSRKQVQSQILNSLASISCRFLKASHMWGKVWLWICEDQYSVVHNTCSFSHLVSSNGDQIWSPESCDLTTCNFFLWEFLKFHVYVVQSKTCCHFRRCQTSRLYHLCTNISLLNHLKPVLNCRSCICMKESIKLTPQVFRREKQF